MRQKCICLWQWTGYCCCHWQLTRLAAAWDGVWWKHGHLSSGLCMWIWWLRRAWASPTLSLVPRPSHRPVFDRLQYAKTDVGRPRNVLPIGSVFMKLRVGYRVGQRFISGLFQKQCRGGYRSLYTYFSNFVARTRLPHTSETALRTHVCMLVCLRPYTVNFKWAHLFINTLRRSSSWVKS